MTPSPQSQTPPPTLQAQVHLQPTIPSCRLPKPPPLDWLIKPAAVYWISTAVLHARLQWYCLMWWGWCFQTFVLVRCSILYINRMMKITIILITLMFVNVCFGPMFNPGATQFLVAECNILHSTVSSKTSSSFNDDDVKLLSSSWASSSSSLSSTSRAQEVLIFAKNKHFFLQK